MINPNQLTAENGFVEGCVVEIVWERDGIVKQNRNVGLYFDWDVEDLITHARALEAMLKKHEFSGGDHSIWCPECKGYYADGHSPDCELARLLE